MKSDKNTPTLGATLKSFFIEFLQNTLKDLLLMAIVFSVTTGISAAVCLYYGVPLWVSLIGGFLSLGLIFFIKSYSIFSIFD